MDYLTYQLQKEKEFEDICQRCGNCCGLKDDPCEQLVLQDSGKYFCRVYASRQGQQKTRSGKRFQCVLVRDILHNNWPGVQKCGYR